MDRDKNLVAYVTSMYPKASHTFILREIACLEAAGISVLPCSIREPDASELIGPEEVADHTRTFYVINEAKQRPFGVLKTTAGRLFRQPGRFFSTLGKALSGGVPGLRGRLYQLFYFIEALILADKLALEGARHIHDHFGASSCSVAMLAAKLNNISFSFTVHGPDIFFNAHDMQLGNKIADAKFVICISNYCRSQCMIFSDQVHWDKLHIMHCGVEPSKYAREEPTQSNGKNLIFVGRLSGVKGVPVLLDALAKAVQKDPEISLKIVGDGPDRDTVTAQVAALGLTDRVTFTGYLSQTGVSEAIAASDILVLPSFAEGVPIVLMEAMAAGKPVVTSRIAGIAELVENGKSGYLLHASDVDSLAECLEQLTSDPDLQRDMGVQGQGKIANEFTISKEVKVLIDLLA